MVGRAPTVLSRLFPPLRRIIGVRGHYILKRIADSAGSIPPLKKLLVVFNKHLQTFEISHVENSHELNGEPKISSQYFGLSAFAPIPLDAYLPNRDPQTADSKPILANIFVGIGCLTPDRYSFYNLQVGERAPLIPCCSEQSWQRDGRHLNCTRNCTAASGSAWDKKNCSEGSVLNS